MKIGMLIGALGMALAAGAQAQRAAAPNAAGVDAASPANTLSTSSVDSFIDARDDALGTPGSAKRAQVLRQMDQAIRRGQYDSRQALVGNFGINYEKQWDAKAGPGIYKGDRSRGGPIALGAERDAGDPPFGYFDAFETYAIDPNPNDSTFTGLNLNGQFQPSGALFEAFTLPHIVACSPDDDMGMGITGAAELVGMPNNHRNPFAPDPIPGDPNGAVNQVMGHMRANEADGGQNTGGFFAAILGHSIFAATPTDPLVQTVDLWFPDHNVFFWVDGRGPGDQVPAGGGGTVARWFLNGFDNGGFEAFTDPDGFVRRPIMLGLLANVFGFGQFFAPPENPAPGLATFRTATNEWVTIANRIDLSGDPDFGGLSQWMRQSTTDGSGATTIDDPRDVPGFESGWAEVYPGQPANVVSGTTFEGVGTSVNEFGQLAPNPSPILNQVAAGSLRMITGFDPATFPVGTDVSNFFLDNYTIVGGEFDTPPQPKLRIPYKDDFELYSPPNVLFLQGSTWTDVDASLARMLAEANTTPGDGTDLDGMPAENSLNQENFVTDSFWRDQFGSIVPGYDEDMLPENRLDRPVATPGNPVTVSVNVRLEFTSTTRGLSYEDNDFSGEIAGELVFRNHDTMGVNDNILYVRLENPDFDATQDELNRQIDQIHNPMENTRRLNYPTTTAMPLNTYFNVTLTMNGDGTSKWTVDGSDVMFDLSGMSASQASIITSLNSGAAGPLFPSKAPTLDFIQYACGNNPIGVGDEIWIDDICIDGPTRVGGLGPVYELPYWDSFECYVQGQHLGGQGDSPFFDATSVNDFDLRPQLSEVDAINCRDNLSGTPTGDVGIRNAGAQTGGDDEYCLYTVLTDTNAGGPEVSDVVAVRKWDGFSCDVTASWTECDAAHAESDSGTWSLIGMSDSMSIGSVNYFANRIQGFDGNTPGAYEPTVRYAAQDWCCYEVVDVFGNVDRKGNALPNDWCIESGDIINLKPGPNGECEPRTYEAGCPNFILFDDEDGDRFGCVLGVNSLGVVNNDGYCADYVGDNFRLLPDDEPNNDRHVFCRYEINTAPTPIDIPGPDATCPNWTVGSIVALDQVVGFDAKLGVSSCPGVFAAGAGTEADFTIIGKDRCEICEGTWTLISSEMVENPPMSGMFETVAAAEPLQAGDIIGYELFTLEFSRWANINGGRGDDTLMVDASSILNESSGNPVDPMGLFNEVVCFANNGNLTDDGLNGVEWANVTATIPTAQAVSGDPATIASAYWDIYVTDLRSRNSVSISGTGGEITRVRVGGPDATGDSSNANGVGVSDDRVGVYIPNFMGGFPVPVPEIYIDPMVDYSGMGGPMPSGPGFTVAGGQWYRFCLNVDGDGQWTLGINDSGAPGDSVNDCDDAYYTTIASGTSIDLDDGECGTGLPVNTINGFTVFSGYDTGGIGDATLGDILLEALAPDEAAPLAGFGSFDYCFYDVTALDAGATLMVQPIDRATGALDGGLRAIGTGDIIAVKFVNPGPFNVNCPQDPIPDGLDRETTRPTAGFEFQDGMAMTTASGTMSLLGSEGEVGVVNEEPGGGINTGGPMTGVGYNDPPMAMPGPHETILLACFPDPLPTLSVEPRSRCYVDNIHIKETQIVSCPWDLDGSGDVGASDLATLIGFWGQTGVPADFDGGGVGASDLAELIGRWGPCP